MKKNLIAITGKNNHIYLIKNNGKRQSQIKKLDNVSINICGDNNCLELHESIPFLNAKISIYANNCYISIKRSSLTSPVVLDLEVKNGDNQQILIGENFSCAGLEIWSHEEGSSLVIGNNVMISKNVSILTSDTHSIFYNDSNFPVNLCKCPITIGNNVWIGRNSLLTKNVMLGDNIIVGAGSVVTHAFKQENVCIAGNPAKVIKENVSWKRTSISFYIKKEKEKNKMKNYISIVFAADDGYALPTAVAITSLLLNKNPETVYKVYIISPSLSEENIRKLKSLENETCSVEIIFAAELLTDKAATLPKVSSTDYYRLMLDTLLPNEEKVIALDGDLLVLKDLTSLWNIDLENNYLAGCYFRPHDMYNRQYVQDVLGLDIGKRINIGVMLMNLKKIKADKLQEKFLSKIGVFQVMSEDIINFVCKDKIKYIPIKYNFNLHFYKFRDLLVGDPHYSMQEYDEADKMPTIFHYTLEKPWKVKTKRQKEWLHYFKKSPYKHEKLRITSTGKITLKERLFSVTFKEKGNKLYAIIRLLGLKFKVKAHR